MQASRVRRAVVFLAVLAVVSVASAVLAAGGAVLQDEANEQDGGESQAESAAADGDEPQAERAAVDADRVNVTMTLEPAADADEPVEYNITVVGEIDAANDAAADTVECTGELCVVNGTLPADASGDERPRYHLQGVVTGVAPAEGITTRVNGTLEGDALEGLGLGAYNATSDGGNASANDTTGAETLSLDIGEADAAQGDGSSELLADGGTVQSDADGESADGTDSESTGDTDGESADTDGESATDTAAGEPATDGGETEADTGGDSTGNDAGNSSPVSITFDGCSSATIEGDAYAYEASTSFYVQSGYDTMTYDESDVETPVTVDGDEIVGGNPASDVVLEHVLVLDEDFGVVAQKENPNHDECVDRIKQQYENGSAE